MIEKANKSEKYDDVDEDLHQQCQYTYMYLIAGLYELSRMW